MSDSQHDAPLPPRSTSPAPRDAGGGPRVEIAGRTLLNFASDDALGLSTDPRVTRAAREAIERFGVGAGSPMLATGMLALHEELAAALAEHVGAERVQLFASSWEACSEVVGALVEPGDTLFVDEEACPSLAQGAEAAGADVVEYAHVDADDLARRLLNEESRGRAFVATDGVFPETARVAPLSAIAAVVRATRARLILHDALGVGVMGPNGRGSAAHADITSTVLVTIGSLGRALGSQGGWAAGSAEVMSRVAERGWALRESVALAPPLAAAALAALRVAQREPGRVASLARHVERLRTDLAAMGLPIAGDAGAPRVIVPVGGAMETRELSAHLQAAGLLVRAILPPSAPEGSCGIALVPMATHTDTDLDDVMMAFASANPGLLPG